jgi:hypothetical protein
MSGRSWELEVCSVCGTVCGPPNDVPAAHTSEVSSCAEEGGQIERVRVYEHPTKPAAIEAWTCLSCGAIGRAQSCAECGGESQPGRWVRAGEHPTDGGTDEGVEKCWTMGAITQPLIEAVTRREAEVAKKGRVLTPGGYVYAVLDALPARARSEHPTDGEDWRAEAKGDG